MVAKIWPYEYNIISMLGLLFLLPFFISPTFAQVADAAFFPSVKSLNPGISHLRKTGFLALDLSKTDVTKFHDIKTGGLLDGVNTEVELKKKTFFRAGRGGGITVELLADQEEGTRTERLRTATESRVTQTTTDSGYFGGIIDFGLFGVMLGKANYDYLYNFRVGTVPNISARDIEWKYNFDVLKIGTTIKFGGLSLGLFTLTQKSSGDLSYTFYDPNTGNKGSVEDHSITTQSKGYGVGLGHSSNVHHIEVSLEKITDQTLNKPDDLPLEMEKAPLASRISMVGEFRYTRFAFGVRYRIVKGNFYDLEDIISSKLLYEEMSQTDERTETTFNFSLGQQKGITYSAFYSVSKVNTEEESAIFQNDILYPALTKSKAMGINISYIY